MKKITCLFLLSMSFVLYGCSAQSNTNIPDSEDAIATCEQQETSTESVPVQYVRSILYLNGNYYVSAGESSIYLPGGYEKAGKVIYSDKNELPQENFVMIPNAEDTRTVYQNRQADEDIYIEFPYLQMSDKIKTKFPHYARYVKEENPEVFAAPVEGFYTYVYMDGISFTADGSYIELEQKVKDNLKMLGTIENCNEEQFVEQNGYGGQERYLGAVIYKDASTGIYYMNMADDTLWIELQ